MTRLVLAIGVGRRLGRWPSHRRPALRPRRLRPAAARPGDRWDGGGAGRRRGDCACRTGGPHARSRSSPARRKLSPAAPRSADLRRCFRLLPRRCSRSARPSSDVSSVSGERIFRQAIAAGSDRSAAASSARRIGRRPGPRPAPSRGDSAGAVSATAVLRGRSRVRRAGLGCRCGLRRRPASRPSASAAAPCDSRASAGSRRSPRPTRRCSDVIAPVTVKPLPSNAPAGFDAGARSDATSAPAGSGRRAAPGYRRGSHARRTPGSRWCDRASSASPCRPGSRCGRWRRAAAIRRDP